MSAGSRFLLPFFLCAVLLTGCAGAASQAVSLEAAPLLNPPLAPIADAGAWPSFPRPAGVPEEFQPAAQSDSLQLFINPANASILLADRRSGHQWTSVPPEAAGEQKLAGIWKRRGAIPILVEYAGADRSSLKAVRPEDMQINVSPAVNGARVVFDIPGDGLGLEVFFILAGDSLEVSIPDSSIREDGENGFVSVQVLPFLGASPDDGPGYIFYPDGSGMLVRFNSPHRSEVQETSRPVYGSDQLLPPTSQMEPFSRQPIVMPVFGLTTGDDGFLGILTHGDLDASISMARSGEGMPFNRAWSEFTYRRQGMFSLNGDQPVVLYQPDRVGGDRQVRYVFITGRAAYEDMAARYRDYLIGRGAKRVQPGGALMDLHFFMGIEQRTWFLSDFIPMTTFDQVKTTADALAAGGVTRVDLTLEGWNQGGVDAHYPQRLPVEKRLGGADDLRALADSLHARGQKLFLLDDYLDILPGSKGAFPIMDAVRGVDGLPVGDNDAGYYLNPQVALDRFALKDIPQMKPWGADGLYLQDLAALAAPDANLRHPLTRENFAATWMQIAGEARSTLGGAVLDGGNLYALPYADRLENVPLESTGYDFGDGSVPFYQMAVHGLVQYSGRPVDLSSDPRRQFLRSVELGAVPVYILTRNDTALLYRTRATWLWSGQVSAWQDEILREYHALEALAGLQDQFITAREQLADGVVQVTYESGARVIVNYTDRDYRAGGLVVKALDFILLP